MRDILQHQFDKYLVKIVDFKKHNCTELVQISELNGVVSLCKIFDVVATEKNGVRLFAILVYEVCLLLYHHKIKHN